MEELSSRTKHYPQACMSISSQSSEECSSVCSPAFHCNRHIDSSMTVREQAKERACKKCADQLLAEENNARVLRVQQAKTSLQSLYSSSVNTNNAVCLLIVSFQQRRQSQQQTRQHRQDLSEPFPGFCTRNQIVEEEGETVGGGEGEFVAGEVEGMPEIGDGKEKDLAGVNLAVIGSSGQGFEGFNHLRWPEQRR